MKKISAIVLGFLIAEASALAATNVLSRNAVGYVQVSVETGKLTLARMDFEPLNGVPFAITNLIGDQLPSGSSVLLWDKSAQSYIPVNKTRSGWGSGGTTIIQRGESFFLRGPGSGSSSGYTVYLMGEVPDSITAPTSTLAAVPGLGMYGFPYPVQVHWTNTFLAKSAIIGDTLLIWDYDDQSYVPVNKTRSGWSDPSVVIKPGQGFWYRNIGGQIEWKEPKPYSWP